MHPLRRRRALLAVRTHLELATDCAAYPVAVGVALNPIVRLQAPGRGHVDGEDVFAASPRERAAG